MTEQIRRPPTGAARLLWRTPIYLYRAHLGWLLGDRMMLLQHVGRRSGLPRTAVIEVVLHDQLTGDYYACSGFGERSQWCQNLMAHPDVWIQVGRRRIPVRAERLPEYDGVALMLDYARRHPKAAQKLVGFIGFPPDGRRETYEAAGKVLPFIRFRRRPQ